MHKGEPVQVKVNGRIGIDVAFFYEMNPNYYPPRVETSSPMSFSDNAFYEVVVDDTRNIEWSPSLFKSLTSSDDQKLLLMALMRTQLGIVPSLPFDDFVTGKGKGLNVLLLGPLGVGKTLTAEAMSEHFQRPLHSISAAQLAVEPDRLEDNLTHIFQIAKRFDTLLLLDKADVFLERRASINASKDATVTIFLRKLEYFQGIFFLTTNRDAELDEAILSRIHLKLKYEALNQRQRKDMWARFATRARTHQGPVMVSDTDLDRLAILDLNGREVSLYCNHLVQVLPLRQRAISKT
ncbi:hypothetical protein LOZ53_001075 [Ophidiomyces ophidiicola]|nr:hypothetical protein LOZ55_005502 [Ophidiomyces ophidiicola]KAI1996474.1 hypothetical protein LOZ53_001075 [Ophidiomyces ophidiicola]